MSGFRLTREQVREVDRLASADYAIPGIVLMENAGRSTAHLIEDLFVSTTPSVRQRWRCSVFCGPGNNGGDGFVIARWLFENDLSVECFCTAGAAETRGDAKVARAMAEAIGIPMRALASADDLSSAREHLLSSQLAVDALLGTGFEGTPRPEMARAIRSIGELCPGARVLAVDVPSGLDCDTGIPADPCVRADVTATFVAEKVGFDTPSARNFLGRVYVLGIGAPRDAVDRARGSKRRRLTGR